MPRARRRQSDRPSGRRRRRPSPKMFEGLEGRLLLSAGDLDSTFGSGGKVLTDFPGANNYAYAAEPVAGGKVVVAGSTDGAFGAFGTGTDFALARYNADGSPDLTFGGGDGVVTLDFGAGGVDVAHDLAVQPDGKLVVVGEARPDSADYSTADVYAAVARFNADGSPDLTFGGGDGVALVRGANSDDWAQAVRLLPGGKIVIAGASHPDDPGEFSKDFSKTRFFIARLNADGSPDASFGAGGRVTTLVTSPDAKAVANALAVLPDGDYLAAGGSRRSVGLTISNPVFARYNPDGSLDPSLDGDGVLVEDFIGTLQEEVRAVAIDGAGKILAAGTADGRGFIQKLNPDGSWAAGFGPGGPVKFSNPSQVNDLDVLPGGDVLVSGSSYFVGATAARFSAAGEQVASSATNAPSRARAAYAAVPLADGGFLLAGDGSANLSDRLADADVALTRLDAALRPVNSFGGAGDATALSDFGAADAANDLALAPGGKLVAAGNVLGGGSGGVARYNADGSPDASFGAGGRARTLDRQSLGLDRANGVAVLGDGSVLVAGRGARGGNADFAVSKFTPAGAPDASFGTGQYRGVANDGTSFSYTDVYGRRDEAFDVAVLPDGRVLAVGRGGAGGDDLALVRYLPDGRLDATFGGDGITTLDLGGDDVACSVALQGDGKFVVAGSTDGDVALVRFNADGTVDYGFGNGRVVADFGGAADAAKGVAVLGDGKVLVAGQGGAGGDLLVARYTAAGAPDRTFGGGGGGVVTADFGGAETAGGLALLDGGRFAVAGSTRRGMSREFAVARFNADGSPDTAFGGGDGRVTTGFGDLNDGANAVVADGAGRLIAAGGAGDDFGLARYQGGGGGDDNPPPTGQTYEAEQAVLSGAVVADNNAGYTGTGFADYYNLYDDYVEFTVNAASAGSYTLTFRYANGSSAARGMELKVNGAARPGGIAFDPTGSWTTWKTVTVTAQLNAGANKVRLTANGQTGPNLDSLTVAPARQPPPADRVYQAESAALSGAVVADDHAGYVGSGFADYYNLYNDYVEFDVAAPAAGAYDLAFRYANGGAAARTLGLRANGQALDVAFGPTGSWAAWATVTVRSVSLAAGANKVRLTAVGQSGPNLDQLTVRAV